MSGLCWAAISQSPLRAAPNDPFDREVLPLSPIMPVTNRGTQPDHATQNFPRLPEAPSGAPNVILILTDDIGFGAASTFGGPIPTPNLDRLAERGVKYNEFHSTAMCSPTRAALLTGRNHHAVGVGTLTDFASGQPGYVSIMPKSAATIAEILRGNGYNTAFFGKHHNIPIGQLSPAGPFDQWPTGLGFEYFFGFLGSDTDQWRPTLIRGTSVIPTPAIGAPLDRQLADDAIDWLHNQKASAPDKPFFVYFATGSGHTPHQAPADWIARFHGRFDQGWNKLSAETLRRQQQLGIVPPGVKAPPWPADVAQWEKLSLDERKVHARYMEAFAAMLAYEDAQIGRLLDEVNRMGLTDNTLVMWVVGDNGADAAGSPDGAISEVGEIANKRSTLADKLATLDQVGGPHMQTNYGTGWALAMDTPFRYYKQVASHLGGTRNGMVVSWPAGIRGRGVRSQYHHVIDILPTILSSAGLPPPRSVNGFAQQPIDGISMTYTFDHPLAIGRRRTQYYEMLGNRAIYHDGWLANTSPVRKPWQMAQGPQASENLAQGYEWELYDLRKDFGQSLNLAGRYPSKLTEMRALFDAEAAKYGVFPLDDRTGYDRFAGMRATYARPRTEYVYWGKRISLSPDVAPVLANRSFSIQADVAIAPDRRNGVMLAHGSEFGGWSFYLLNGTPVVAHALSQLPQDRFRLVAPSPIATGRAVRLTFAFDYDGGGAGKGGTVRIAVDGQKVASARLDRSIVQPADAHERFDVGQDHGVPVSEDLPPDGTFEGELDKLTVKLGEVGRSGQIEP